jgi:hypothetical protein
MGKGEVAALAFIPICMFCGVGVLAAVAVDMARAYGIWRVLPLAACDAVGLFCAYGVASLALDEWRNAQRN